MVDYAPMDPYKRSRYEQGIDAKIVVMGNTGVGKTSLLHRYTQNKFDPRNTTSTTGAFFVTKKVYVNGLKVRLQLWDTAGQERFRSMAPMYYRGANAALLLYDITNAATFEDVRGWLEELKKNCSAELIIYIVGSKADLQQNRQVTSDLARLSLHTWFPPPKPPTPPPQPTPPPSTLSYIRPRFTSFTSSKSAPLSNAPNNSSPPKSAVQPDQTITRSTALQRSNTGAAVPRWKPPAGPNLTRSKTTTDGTRSGPTRYAPQANAWPETIETSSNSVNEEDFAEEDDQEWGLHKGMELFEVSAKDDMGIHNLFDSLITAIIERKDVIERENELKKRDSVFLSSVSTPTWAAQAAEEEAREKARASSNGWSCCSS